MSEEFRPLSSPVHGGGAERSEGGGGPLHRFAVPLPRERGRKNEGEAEIERFISNAKTLEDGHAYSPADEHDACGVGFVAAIDGKPRRNVVARAIDALKAVWHRGAVDADGKTGDGCGIHLQVPQDFFREAVQQTGHKLRSGRIAVGQIFLPRTDYNA